MSRNGTYHCPVEAAVAVIGGKWKTLILWKLRDAPLRFSELQERLPIVTPRMLTKALRELAEDGIVGRTAHAEIPPRVEYALTPLGEALTPVLDALNAWGIEYMLDAEIPFPVCCSGKAQKEIAGFIEDPADDTS
jgi:DNA-binding HxlR family transcriptional regulator